MTIRQKLQLKFALVILLALIAGLVSYPQIFQKIPMAERVYDIFSRPKINLGLDLQGGIHMEYRADVSKVDSSQVSQAMQAVQDVISRRVDAFGVAEPVIYATKAGSENRLVVELAGVKDIEKAKSMIQETPFLEFKEEQIDENNKGKGGELGFVGRGMLVPEFDSVIFDSGLRNGQVYKDLVETQYGWHIIKKLDERTVPTEDPTLSQEGAQDNIEVNAAHILFAKQKAQENQPAEMVDEINAQNKSKAEEVLKKALAGEDFATLANENSQDPGNQPEPNFVATGLTGKNLKNASVTFQSQGMAEPQVSLKFDDEGTKLFAEITKKSMGKRVAIYLDGQVISAPTVQAEITTGEAVITGNFTVDQAKELVRRLNEGALPVPISLVSQQSIEASLGQISLEKSLKAGMVGLLLVIIFMILYYRFLGVIASLALLIYTAIMVSIFKLSGFTPWSITLSLPGIAGFVLSIGMAVDANILIFERTKEEVRRGRKLLSAVDEGFKRAWTSIRDGNASSIITALILLEMGTGFVKGFAVTLLIGVLVSMFTAVMITRTILNFILGDWVEDKMWLIGANKREE